MKKSNEMGTLARLIMFAMVASGALIVIGMKIGDLNLSMESEITLALIVAAISSVIVYSLLKKNP